LAKQESLLARQIRLEEARKEMIAAKIKQIREEKRILSFRDLIDSPIPSCQYVAGTSGSSTVAAVRLEPAGWIGLESAVEKHRLELASDNLNYTPMPSHNFPRMSSATHEYESEEK
jgi:hypothetical protein